MRKTILTRRQPARVSGRAFHQKSVIPSKKSPGWPGSPDRKAIAFLTWGSWADGVVERAGSMLRKFRTRTREGYCSVGHEVKLELI